MNILGLDVVEMTPSMLRNAMSGGQVIVSDGEGYVASVIMDRPSVVETGRGVAVLGNGWTLLTSTPMTCELPNDLAYNILTHAGHYVRLSTSDGYVVAFSPISY